MSTDTGVVKRVGSHASSSWWNENRHRVLRFLWLGSLQIFMTLLVITFLVPTFWMIISSFKVSTEVFAYPIVWFPKTLHWQNYVEAVSVFPFLDFALNTFIVTAVATLGTVVSCSAVAYSFARLRWPGRDFFFGLAVATMMLPNVVMIIPSFIMFRTFGWINTFLPLTVPYWFGTATFYVFLLRQFMRGIPMELEDAARIDGASRFRTLVQILIPLSKPVLATVAVFSMLQHYNDFMGPLIYLNSWDKWTMALGVRAYNTNYFAQWELVFAVGTIMLTPLVIVFVAAQRYFVQGMVMSGFGGQ